MKIRKNLPIEFKLTAWRCRVVVLKAALKEESMVAMEICRRLRLTGGSFAVFCLSPVASYRYYELVSQVHFQRLQ
jgi:hypothetical protein